MKKIQLLMAIIAMLTVSTVAFGQSIKIKDPPVTPYPGYYQLPVTVEWHRADGVVLTQTVYTTEPAITSGIIVTAPPYYGTDCPILTIKIYVYFVNETHYAIYPGTATKVSRLAEPQYWIVIPD